MLKELVKVANRLDSLGLTREADVLDRWINKVAAGAPRVTSGFDPSKIKGINEAADSIITAMKSVVDGGSLPSMKGVLSLTAENPFMNQLNYIIRTPSGVNITDENIRGLLVQSYNHSGGNYSKVPTAEQHLFEEVVVAGAQRAARENRKYIINGPAAPENKPNTSGVQAQTEGTTYPKATPTAPTPKKTPSGTPTKSSPSAPKRDWAYYLSKQTEEVGKAMETLWSNASMEMNMKPDYASFVSWYKSKGKNMNPAEAARKMFGDVLSKSKDPLVSSVLNSRAAADPENINALYSYVGINPKTYLPASGQEQTTAETRLRAISSAMGHEADAAEAGRQRSSIRDTLYNK